MGASPKESGQGRPPSLATALVRRRAWAPLGSLLPTSLCAAANLPRVPSGSRESHKGDSRPALPNSGSFTMAPQAPGGRRTPEYGRSCGSAPGNLSLRSCFLLPSCFSWPRPVPSGCGPAFQPASPHSADVRTSLPRQLSSDVSESLSDVSPHSAVLVYSLAP